MRSSNFSGVVTPRHVLDKPRLIIRALLCGSHRADNLCNHRFENVFALLVARIFLQLTRGVCALSLFHPFAIPIVYVAHDVIDVHAHCTFYVLYGICRPHRCPPRPSFTATFVSPLVMH